MLQEQEQQQIRVFKTFLQLLSKAGRTSRSQAENRCKICRESRRNLHYFITILKINVILIKLNVLL